jgi:thiol-disulfide isomerase/thioredoxin
MKRLILVLAMLFSMNSLIAIEVGQKAINFQATTLDGKEISFEQFKGKKIVWLIFWATWCPYCGSEISALKDLYEKYNDKLEIIAVNVGVNDSIEKANAYMKVFDLPYNVIFSHKITKDYQVRGVPTQIVIDIHGNVIFKGTKIPVTIGDETIDSLMKK